MTPDAVDRMAEQWRRERPDIDPVSMAVFARISRVHGLVDASIQATLAPFGLSRGEFDVLASLRRSGSPFSLTAGQLARAVVLSPSAMTHRLTGLEGRQLVHRRPDPQNGRIVEVRLTRAGRALVDRAVVRHVEALDHALDGVSPTELRSLTRALAGLERRLAP